MNDSKIYTDFDLLREHCIKLIDKYNTFTILFDEEYRKLLLQVANYFFFDLNEIMIRDFLLNACMLMDPAFTYKNGKSLENISIDLINRQLKSLSKYNPDVDNITKSILEYGKKIKPARNKRLAHYDRENQIHDIVLGETTIDELDQFLSDIKDYCNIVGNILGAGPLDILPQRYVGGVGDLLEYLTKNNSIIDPNPPFRGP